MGWFARKLDTFCGAIFAGVAGAGSSQFDAFVQQYLQRLGGHIDEARRLHETMLNQDRYRQLDQAARDLLTGDSLARHQQLEGALRAISESELWTRPFVFFRNVDFDIAARTWEQFRPSVPADLAGIVYAIAGVVIGLIVYELVKLPFALMFGSTTRPAHSMSRDRLSRDRRWER